MWTFAVTSFQLRGAFVCYDAAPSRISTVNPGPSIRPHASRTAAVWVSLCVWTPPVTRPVLDMGWDVGTGCVIVGMTVLNS